MIWVKSVLAGAVTLLMATVLLVVIQMWLVLRTIEVPRGGEVGLDLVSLAKSYRFWIVALVGFGLGFLWQFRRASR